MVDSSSALHIYDREIDSSERTSLSVLASHIPAGARVLDLGCGSGAIGRFLSARDGAATIDGLTINEDEAQRAAADGQGKVPVGMGLHGVLDEQVPRHLAHGLEHPRIADAARHQLLLDHALAVDGKGRRFAH